MTLISVLPQPEAKEFDEPPVFDSIDRKRFFDLTVALQDALDKLRTPANRVCFLVSYAYFKARKRFYEGEFHEKDIEYACHLLGINRTTVLLESYSRKIRLDHQTAILKLFDYTSFSDCNQHELSRYVYVQVKSYKNPRLIFADMIEYLQTRKIALPRYRQFVNLISDQIQKYKSDIHECLASSLDHDTKAQLDALLSQDDDRQYALRFLKHYKGFRPEWCKNML